MVRKLYKNGVLPYKMDLIAGKNGLDNIVKWVHIIEDDNATTFLHGNELVFTAGILNHSRDWLLNFARKLRQAETSAFVVNIGPHIKEIPRAVVDYCDEVGMPLFTIPWETRMVDMTRDFCRRIMNNEQVENNAATTLKNIIFNIGDMNTQVQQLERCGYQRDSRFSFVSIVTDDGNIAGSEEHQDALGKIAELVAKRMHELYITFSYKESLILVLVNYSDAEVRAFIHDYLTLALQKAKEWTFHMGVSANQTGIYGQKDNFERALCAMGMARRRGELCCYYSELGIYKVLYAVNDKAVLRDFYKSVVGSLEVYDRENRTQLMDMLKAYLENNASIQQVSEKQFVHRNTVTNQLKKVEEITGFNPLELEDKVKLYLAFYIKEIL
jgi:Regulator of polyketide synthase expression